MGRKYGVKFKTLSWDCVQAAADIPLLLDSAALGFDPRRRALMIEVIGMDTNNTLVVQFSADGSNWISIDTPVTGSENYLFNSAPLSDVTYVRPRYTRLVAVATANDPGVVTVNVTGKHVPSTMRKA